LVIQPKIYDLQVNLKACKGIKPIASKDKFLKEDANKLTKIIPERNFCSKLKRLYILGFYNNSRGSSSRKYILEK